MAGWCKICPMSNTQSTRKGHNAIVTGLAMLVLGVAIALATAGEYGSPALNSFSTLVALAGFITAIVGLGLRRERP